MHLTRSWMIAILVLLASPIAFSANPAQFVKKNPMETEFFSLTPKSFQSIKALKNGHFEMQFSGKTKKAKEVFLDQKRISKGSNKNLSAVVRLRSKEQIHEIRVVEEDASENSFYFQVSLKKELPSPLRIRVRSESGEIVEHTEFKAGEYPAKDWIDLEWVSEAEVLSPEELELKETERKRKKVQAALEKEQEELVRLEEEKVRLTQMQGGVAISPERKPTSGGTLAEPMQSVFEVSQGLGFLNLQQSQQAPLETTQWMVQVNARRSSPKGWEAGLHGEGFVIPLKSNSQGSTPRFINMGIDVGTQFDLGRQGKVSPRLGFDYQSLLTSNALGYRNLMGPRLEVAGEYHLSLGEIIKAEVFANLFGSDFSVISPSNYQLGARVSYQWEAEFLSAKSLIAGAQISRLDMVLGSAELKSTVMATFVGVQF